MSGLFVNKPLGKCICFI